MKGLMALDVVTRAKLACIYSGIAWGLFWIPLRILHAEGIQGAWATFVFYAFPALLFIPWLIYRWRIVVKCGLSIHLIGISAGIALVLYANAMLYTEVVRGMLLYYLTPVWSLILARLMLGEAITRARVAAIFLGLCGMLVILGADLGIPMPRNSGDWMGLMGGLVWALTAVLLRKDDGKHALELTAVYFFWGALLAALFAFTPFAGQLEIPDFSSLLTVLPWFVLVALLLVFPAALTAFWGAPFLNPGVVGLLFMTELSVGAITAALWAGEPFGWRELIGVILITLAGLTEFIESVFLRLTRAIWR